MRLLTLARDLRRRRGRERQGLFVAEGLRVVEELLRSPLSIRGVLAGPNFDSTERGGALIRALESGGVEIAHVSEPELLSACDTDTPQGVLAIGEVPSRRLDAIQLEDGCRALVLDALQDPGNTGTILRTAAALDVSLVVALPGTVDLWNAKVVRGAMGAHFHFPALSANWAELDAHFARCEVSLWAADAGGVSVDTVTPPARLALVVGNEGAGLDSETRRRVERTVGLPIAPTVESLNVAVATGILLYALRR